MKLTYLLLIAAALLCPYVSSAQEIRDTTIDAGEETEEIIINSTRTSYHIEDAPLRIEVLGAEELGEKINMRPNSIQMLLSESTGIQTQQNSSLTGSQSIKMQGLSGKYTQILKDGLPVLSGLSSGLGLLQIPPLDLQQVEVIKGPSSTLYGGDAIAGLVNLISKVPEEKPHLSILLNATSKKGYDVSVFASGKNKTTGFTLLVTRNFQKAYDTDSDNFSDLPYVTNVTVNPRLFWEPDSKNKIILSFTGFVEERSGGNMDGINKNEDPANIFTERNKSKKYNVNLDYRSKFKRGFFSLKTLLNLYNRKIEESVNFSGNQLTSFSEASFSGSHSKGSMTGGINFILDKFEEASSSYISEKRSYQNTTIGGFIQADYRFSNFFTTEAGLRIDYTKDYGTFVLPKISFIYKADESISLRGGFGPGYKLPVLFTEETEEDTRLYERISPLEGLKAETSYGGNFDINYKTRLANVEINLNQAFYITLVKNPIRINNLFTGSSVSYINGDRDISKGIETSVSLNFGYVKFYGGYTYIDSEREYEHVSRPAYLTPKHKINSVLVYEKHGFGRAGLECYHFGTQAIEEGNSPSYTVLGFMAEKYFENFSLFLNFENFTNVKLSDFVQTVQPPYNNPKFHSIFAPPEGFVINGGIKLKF